MVVPYGEARALLGGGEDDHHHHHNDDNDKDHDQDDNDFDASDSYDVFFSAVYKYRCNSGLEMDGPDTVSFFFAQYHPIGVCGVGGGHLDVLKVPKETAFATP